jgi:AcrR family transcriptional regulator
MVASPRPQPDAEPTPAGKGQRTRERIFAAAMDLFMSHGYEKTTMRMIADRAGVNAALSYRYFPSKEHLVFEFYQNFARDFIDQSAAAVASSSRLETRLIGVVETMFATAEPYHSFAGSLFASAASPTSPLNPFSADFTPMRADGIALYARVIDGCTPRIPDDLAGELAFLLWTLSLGLLYCWMHDQTEHQEKTRLLLRQLTRLLVGLLRLSSAPGAGQFRRQLVAITRLIQSSLPVGTDGTDGPA